MNYRVEELLFKIKTAIERSLLSIHSQKRHHTRLYENVVSSEDLKFDCKADKILCERQIGLGPIISKKDKWIGYINEYEGFLGDDIIIKEIILHDNKELGEKLTKKYKDKVLICSNNVDSFNS